MTELISVPLWAWVVIWLLLIGSAVVHILQSDTIRRQRKRHAAAMNIARDIFQKDYQAKTRLRVERDELREARQQANGAICTMENRQNRRIAELVEQLAQAEKGNSE